MTQRHLSAWTVALLLLTGCATRPPAAEPGEPPGPELRRVVDGDTLELVAGGLTVRARLARVDAPERGQPGYREATEYVRAWVADRTLYYVQVSWDGRWNRPVVEVYRDGDPVALSDALLAAGLATPWTP